MRVSEANGLRLIVKSILLLGVLSLASCKEEGVKAPEDLIPEDQFVKIIADLDLIEAARSIHISNEQTLKKEPEGFYSQLWQDYSITEARFKSSFSYYQKDLDAMARIYEQAALILKREEDDVHYDKRLERSALKGNQTDSL